MPIALVDRLRQQDLSVLIVAFSLASSLSELSDYKMNAKIFNAADQSDPDNGLFEVNYCLNRVCDMTAIDELFWLNL